MSFRITGLDPAPFKHLYGLNDAGLNAMGVRRYIADACPGFPDRVELRDAEPGEAVLLLNYAHQPQQTPYQSAYAIFVREGADQAYSEMDTIPAVLRSRLISLRAFSHDHYVITADVVDGSKLEELIGQFLDMPQVSYLHAHYAKFGCYAARIDRAA